MTDSTTNENKLIIALMQNEQQLSKLYAIYATLFPDDTEFWTHISNDEIDHARWIDELFIKIQQEIVKIDENRLKIEALNNFTAYINEQIDRTENGDISSTQALSVSMDMENSMIEQGTFTVYESDDIELKNVFDKLLKSTESHYQSVKQRWLDERNKTEI
jgi:rubrerythrin